MKFRSGVKRKDEEKWKSDEVTWTRCEQKWGVCWQKNKTAGGWKTKKSKTEDKLERLREREPRTDRIYRKRSDGSRFVEENNPNFELHELGSMPKE